MKLHRTLLALALTACVAAPAYAFDDDAILYNVSVAGDLVLTGGIVGVSGDVDVRSRSSAVVDQNQDTLGNLSIGEGDMAADFNGGALEGASGNIGVNISSGVGNAQSNDAALSAVDGNRVFASAQTFSSQYSLFNEGTAFTDGFYSAVMEDDALADAAGNIGVNIAAGVGNAQSNGMTASVNTSGRYALATADSAQVSDSNAIGTITLDRLDLFSVLGDGALSGATGNIGVNITAGVGNLQHNGLSIASATSP